MDSPVESNIESSKHCMVQNIKICTRCGSTDIVIEEEAVTCNDYNAILCYEHRK